MNAGNRGTYQTANSDPQACELSLVNGNLYIYLIEQNNDLLIWDIKKINSCAFQGSTLIIFFGNEPVQTLECTGDLALRIYNYYSGVPQEESRTKKSKVTRNIFLIALFAIGFLFWCWVYFIPWLGEKSVAFIPVDLEIQMGDGIAEQLIANSEVNDSASYFANKFVEQLELDETYPIKIKVIQSKELNAFAVPGGRIFIYSALLEKMQSSEELVALLGHEVSHVTQRHSLKSICRTLASSIVLSSFFGDAGGITSGILSQVNQFKSLDYSRELETEADKNGLQIMYRNHVDPKGMIQLLKRLQEASEEQPAIMKYLSTHPETEARINTVKTDPIFKLKFEANEELDTIFIQIKQSL